MDKNAEKSFSGNAEKIHSKTQKRKRTSSDHEETSKIQNKEDNIESNTNNDTQIEHGSRASKNEEAIEAYDEAIKLKPDDDAAYYNKGNALSALGKNEEAIKAYDEAIKLKPDYDAAYYNKGNALSALGKNEEAIKAYDEAIKLKPDYDAAYYNKGNALSALGKNEEAIEAYDEAIKLKPDYATAYNNKGNALHALGKNEEAIKAYDEAIKLKPDYATAYNNKSNALHALGKNEEAIKAYDEAIKLKPDYATAYNTMPVTIKQEIESDKDINPGDIMDLKNTTILAGKQIINNFENIFWPIRNTRFKKENKEKIDINYRGTHSRKIDQDEDKGKKLLEKFKDFYVENIQDGNFCRQKLLKVEKVTNDDPRTKLRGQEKVVAVQDIKVYEILGIYTGILLKDNSEDIKAELDWVLEKFGSGHGLEKLQQYFFDVYPYGRKEPLVLSAYGRGNELTKINAPHTHYPLEQKLIESNVDCVQIDYNAIPFIVFYTKKEINKGEELLFDYGLFYWQEIRKAEALSKAHPDVYERFKQSKYYEQDNLKKEYQNFLAFVRKNEPKLYTEVKDHGIYIDYKEKDILSKELDIKDRLVFDLMKSTPDKLVVRVYRTDTVNINLLENSLKQFKGITTCHEPDFIEFKVSNDNKRMEEIEKIFQVYDELNILGDNIVPVTMDC